MDFTKPATMSDAEWAAWLAMVQERNQAARERVRVRIAVYEQAITYLDSEPEPDNAQAHGLTAEAAKTYLLALITELKRVFDL